MVEIIGCVKDCCKEERNRLLSVRLVNSTKRDKIKLQREKLGLDAKGKLSNGVAGGYCLWALHHWRRWLRTG